MANDQKIRAELDKLDREVAFQILVKLVAEYGWLAGRDTEEIAPMVRSACYSEALAGSVDD
jgi:hypothetical protein